ncbi:MAG: sugar ABC transporter permease [Sphaerochaeta sp.]|nr:sugar ABC transporter permease [Sphaerochaeta sp.]
MFSTFYKKRSIGIVRRPSIFVLSMLVPSLFLVLLFNYYPILQSITYSFFKWSGGHKKTFLGLKNYIDLFTSSVFYISLYNQLVILVLRTIFLIVPALLVARLIFGLKTWAKASNFFRLIFVVPVVIPPIVVLLIWQFLLDGEIGLINSFLQAVSLGNLTRAWLGDPKTALGSVIAIGFPWVQGTNMLIFLAGFLAVDESIWDSVTLEGVSSLQRFFYIDIHLILGQLKLNIILTIIQLMQDFVGIMVLTDGGPGTATLVPGLLLYKNAFQYAKMGYANAIGVVLFVVILSLSILNSRIGKESNQ